MRAVLSERGVADGVPTGETAGLGLEIVQRVFEREKALTEVCCGDLGAVGRCDFVVEVGVESVVVWGFAAEGFEWGEENE